MINQNEYISVMERLPLSGPDDPMFEAPFHEEEMDVIAEGIERTATFWACWELEYSMEAPSVFIMDFDVDGVTHWKRKCK